MQEVKKTYPSQIATKAIAARIPAADYVEFLNDAISKGITLNDWLLTKIYAQTPKNGQLGHKEVRREELFSEEFYQISEEDYQMLNYLKKSFEIEELDGELFDDKITRYAIVIDDLNSNLNMSFTNGLALLTYINKLINKDKKEPSLLDAKTQISIIAKNKLHRNDYINFMKDLNELLRDYEIV